MLNGTKQKRIFKEKEQNTEIPLFYFKKAAHVSYMLK